MVSENKRQVVVSLAGELTWQNAGDVRERLLALVEQGCRSLVVNAEALTYADSSGLTVFLSLNRTLRELGGDFALVDAGESLVRALHQTRMCDFVPVVAKDAVSREASLPPAGMPTSVRTMSVPGDPGSMAQTRRAVGEMLASLGLAHETIYDLVLALGEALGNAFDHAGAQGEDGAVTVTVSVYGDRIVMEVSDRGEGYSFQEGDELPCPTEERGRGIRLMLMLADAVEIRPKQLGQGTCVRLVKLLEPAARPDLPCPACDDVDDEVAELSGASLRLVVA